MKRMIHREIDWRIRFWVMILIKFEKHCLILVIWKQTDISFSMINLKQFYPELLLLSTKVFVPKHCKEWTKFFNGWQSTNSFICSNYFRNLIKYTPAHHNSWYAIFLFEQWWLFDDNLKITYIVFMSIFLHMF